MSDILNINAFLSALDNKEFELRIWKKDPKNLHEAAAITTRLEVYDKAKVNAQSSRKLQSAIIRDVKMEMENAFKKCQNDCQKIQGEIRKVQEEIQRMMVQNRIWPNPGPSTMMGY